MTANSNNATIDRVSRFATRHKFVMLALTLIVTGMFAVGMFRVKGEVLMEELLPYEHPFLQIIFDFSENFGSGGSWVGILIEAKDGDIFKPHILQKIIDIDEEVASWEETFRKVRKKALNRESARGYIFQEDLTDDEARIVRLIAMELD